MLLMNDIEMFIACCENPLTINIVRVNPFTDHITELIQTFWINNEDKVSNFICNHDLENYLIHSFGVSNIVWNGCDVIEVDIYRKE